MRLIDADTIPQKMSETFDMQDLYLPIHFVTFIINEMPTVEERKTGRWVWDEEGYHCSECFFHAYGDTLNCLDGTFKYCPHCGAKMGEVKDVQNKTS